MKRPDPWLHHKVLPPEAQQRLRDAAATMRVLSGWHARQKCLDEAIGSVRAAWPEYFRPEDDDDGWIPPSKGGSKRPSTTMGRRK